MAYTRNSEWEDNNAARPLSAARMNHIEEGMVTMETEALAYADGVVAAALATLAGEGGAALVGLDDAGGFYASGTVEAALQELAGGTLFSKTTGGGGDLVNEVVDASGATLLDLALGNVQHITSTTGSYTLSVSGWSPAGQLSAVLLWVDADGAHYPTWFSGINWLGGAAPTIVWADGDRHLFAFWSLDGGTTSIGQHLTPLAPILPMQFPAITGTVATATGGHRIYNDSGETRTITSVRASVGTAPTGATLIVDVNKNGTTIFTTQSNRPTIAISGNTDEADAVQVASWAAGEYLTYDVDQVGSTVAGSNLVVTVNYRQGG